MTSDRFGTSLAFVLHWEGGFTQNPNDPGGATNKGITQAVFSKWLADHGLPNRDVRQMTDQELRQIYQGLYWSQAHCSDTTPQIDLVHFDTAVNMGTNRAICFLQRVLGCGVDGAFGEATKVAASRCDPAKQAPAYCDLREQYYRTLAQRRPQLRVFLNGWLNRLNAIRAEIGLPGFEALSGHIAKIPDLGVDAHFDF